MSKATLAEWLEAVLLVVVVFALPWVIGYLALALGAVG